MNAAEEFNIIRQLGGQHRRKFAEVFLCQHRDTGEKAVLKVLKKNTANSLEQERLRQEALFHFEQKGLPYILDYIENENELLLFKRYEEGIPLLEYIRSKKTKERIGTLTEVLEKVCSLLKLLHQDGIVHLDLKPANILVKKDEQELKVSIIDFGLALRIDHPEKRPVLFPLGYAAPELLLNQLDLVDRRTDYYNLGISLWQCLAGKLPLIHPNPSITTNLQLTHPLPEADGIPKALHRVLQKMAFKHSFATPPNRIPEIEVRKQLQEAMSQRYDHLEDFLRDWLEAVAFSNRRKWFFF